MTMPSAWQLVVIALVIVILFGARKLPDFARGAGQALRIFKAETKGLVDDENTANAEDNVNRELPASPPEQVDNLEETRDSNPSTRDGN
jgi:sec-independent protein translocase protein TatA